MADLGLADPVNTTKTLFETIGVPREVIVDHQVGALEVDTFTRSICCEQYFDLWIMAERLLNLLSLFTAGAAVDDHNGFFTAQEGGNPVR